MYNKKRLVNSLKDDINKEIVWYTPCNIILHTTNYKITLLDLFVNNVNYFSRFIKNINLKKCKEMDDRFILYGYGYNSCMLLLKKNIQRYLKIQENESSQFCKVNIEFINNIINQITENEPNTLYDNYFIDLLFNPNNSERVKYNKIVKEYDNCIIYPDISKSVINNKIVNILAKLPNENIKDRLSILSNIYFFVLPKSELHEEYKMEYLNILNIMNKETRKLELTKFKIKLSKSYYRTTYHFIEELIRVKNTDNIKFEEMYNKFKEIKLNINNFYETQFGITNIENTCIISTPYFYPQNFWMYFNVQINNIYEGNYESIRTNDYLGNILYEYIDLCIKYSDDLENKFLITFKESFINKFNLSGYCQEFINDRRMPIESTEINCNDIGPIIVKKNDKTYKFDEDFNIIKVLPNKFATTGSNCSYTICGNLNNDYYLISIIPNTMNNLKYNQNKKNFLNNFLNNLNYSKEFFENEEILFYFLENVMLQYKIEIIKLNCFDCETFKKEQCLFSKFEIKNMNFMSNNIVVPFIENNIIGNQINDYILENFSIHIGIILNNIIYNIIKILDDNLSIENNSNINNVIGRLNNILFNLKQTVNNHKYYFDTIPNDCEDIINDMNVNINDRKLIYIKNYPFLCLSSEEYLLYSLYRKVIWYIGFIVNSIDNLEKFVKFFIDIYKLNINRYLIILNKNDIINLLVNTEIIPNNQEYNNFMNTYLLNFLSLYDNTGSFKNVKVILDEYISIIKNNTNLLVTYNFRSPLFLSTFHVHISKKNITFADKSYIFDNIRNYSTISANKPVLNQNISSKNYYLINNYNNLSKFMYFRHYIRLDLNSNKIIKYINNYEDMLNGNLDEIINFINEIIDMTMFNKDIVNLLCKLICINPIDDTLYNEVDLVNYNNKYIRNIFNYFKFKLKVN